MKTSDDLLRAAEADDTVGRVFLLCGVLNLITAGFAMSAPTRSYTILFSAAAVMCVLCAVAFFKLAERRRRRATGDDA